jgi:hypothetical protein
MIFQKKVLKNTMYYLSHAKTTFVPIKRNKLPSTDSHNRIAASKCDLLIEETKAIEKTAGSHFFLVSTFVNSVEC